MSEGFTITTEQVDDFPVLIAQMKRTAIPDLLNRHFPMHGNWQGLSLGWTGTAWLGHILSVGDHRLNHVQPWVEKNPQTVQRSLGQPVTGLIRLLSIGLRVLTLLEFVVLRGLAQNQEQLAGLYAGNPKRTTATPRAETLLEFFKNIYLNTVTTGEQIFLHITPLSDLQRKILSLLSLSPDIYSQLAAESPKPP